MQKETASKAAKKKTFSTITRRRTQDPCNERISFERLISDLSARFVNVASDQVDQEIERTLEHMRQFFRVERVGMCGFSPDLKRVYITYMACAEGIERVAGVVELSNLFPWIYERVVLQGEPVLINKLKELPERAEQDSLTCTAMGILSFVNIPLFLEGEISSLIFINAMRVERSWPEGYVPRLRLLGEIFINALARKNKEAELRERLIEIEKLKERLEKENIYLQEEVKLLTEHKDIVGQSVAMKKILSQAEQVAHTDSTVLLLGETGTGKELLARAIHSMSARKDRPMVTVNCASLPVTLIESELFGREKGAYTGALTKMIGRFELADGSTLFLDEIGELPFELQSKLLRFLEEGTFERLGSTKPLHVNVRIIAATNRDIEKGVKEGTFRRDLFYRMNVFPIVIPPLRKRPEDIPLLVRAVVKEFQKRMGKEIESIPKHTMQALQSYSWPGNIRELRNVIEHAMILSGSKSLDVQVPKHAPAEENATDNLNDIERKHIVAVLERTGWRIGGQGGAAEFLGLKRTTLQEKMKKLGITRSNKSMP